MKRPVKQLIRTMTMIALSWSVTGCDNLSAQDRAVVEDLRSQLDFARLRSAGEAEAALAAHFPRFDDAHYARYASPEAADRAMAKRAGEVKPLLAYLDDVATRVPGLDVPKKSHREVAWLLPSAPRRSHDYFKEDTEARLAEWKKSLIPADAYFYTVFVPQEDKNNNLWAIWLIVSKDGVVLDSEIRLTYMDENFSARGIPFRVVNAIDAGPKWTRKILFDLLGDDITPASVDRLMMEGGAERKKITRNTDDSIDYVFYFEKGDPRIISQLYGDNRLVVMSWTFDADGKFQNLYMTGDETYTARGSR